MEKMSRIRVKTRKNPTRLLWLAHTVGIYFSPLSARCAWPSLCVLETVQKMSKHVVGRKVQKYLLTGDLSRASES